MGAGLESLQSIVYIPSGAIERQVGSSSFSWPAPSETRAADLVKVESRSMVSVYYELVSTLMKVPHQDEFALEYLKMNADFLSNFPEEVRLALYHRARRAWGTFVAEHHLYGLLVETGRYTCRKAVLEDVGGRADMVIKNGRGQFALDVHTGTWYSKKWRELKQFRHEQKPDLLVLELPLIGAPYTKKVPDREGKAYIHLFLPSVVSFIEAWRRNNSMPPLFIGRIAEIF